MPVKYKSMFGCLPTFAVNASTGPTAVGAPSTAAPKYFRDGVSKGRTSYGSTGAADGSAEGAGHAPWVVPGEGCGSAAPALWCIRRGR